MPKRAAWSRSIDQRQHAAAICWSEATSRSCGSFCSFASSCGAQPLSSLMSESCSVYWILGARDAAADVEILARLQEQRRARHLRELLPQAVDDLIGGGGCARRAASGR